MDPKDFKFNDDAFDGVFPEQEDSFEDIYSGRQSESHRRSFESEFDDIFSGRQDWLEDRPYEDNYYEEQFRDILAKILYSILALIILTCLFIGLCAVNPDIANPLKKMAADLMLEIMV